MKLRWGQWIREIMVVAALCLSIITFFRTEGRASGTEACNVARIGLEAITEVQEVVAAYPLMWGEADAEWMESALASYWNINSIIDYHVEHFPDREEVSAWRDRFVIPFFMAETMLLSSSQGRHLSSENVLEWAGKAKSVVDNAMTLVRDELSIYKDNPACPQVSADAKRALDGRDLPVPSMQDMK